MMAARTTFNALFNNPAAWRRVLSVLAVLTFLAAQAIAVAHDARLDGASHGSQCLTCHLAKDAPGSLPVDQVTLELPAAADRVKPVRSRVTAKRVPIGNPSRAPPSFS